MPKELPQAEIGVFGGSGFYSLFDEKEEVEIETPYGKPSDTITVGTINGHRVAFLPRHGRNHSFAPHAIPYLANLWAMKQLGVKKIIAPCAAGSLQPSIHPGEFVICDQFLDRTSGRPATFYHGPKVIHVSCAEPYCPAMRKLAIESCKKLSIPVHEKGTVVTIEGPRFSTRAESHWYQKAGFEVIGMTQYPEVVLARELEMCYVNISLITDYDAGLVGQENIKAVDAKSVGEIFSQNVSRVKDLIFEMIKNLPSVGSCECEEALTKAAL